MQRLPCNPAQRLRELTLVCGGQEEETRETVQHVDGQAALLHLGLLQERPRKLVSWHSPQTRSPNSMLQRNQRRCTPGKASFEHGMSAHTSIRVLPTADGRTGIPYSRFDPREERTTVPLPSGKLRTAYRLPSIREKGTRCDAQRANCGAPKHRVHASASMQLMVP